MYENHAIYFPQDELSSVLLPVTAGCSYNKCVFCSMYKDDVFREIPLWDIEKELMNGPKYAERVFLTGADPMSVGYEKMVEILSLIRRYLPYCACVASYASIRSVSKYSLAQLTTLHHAGLRQLYIGFETGRDDVLNLMKKGHSTQEAVTQAQKLNAAQLPFNTIIMYGIAGKNEGKANAVATAEMINQFRTVRIITMNLTIFYGTELSHMIERHAFIPSSGRERLDEIRMLLERLSPEHPTIFDTTHPTNIIKLKGTLPDDKVRLLKEVDRFIAGKTVFI